MQRARLPESACCMSRHLPSSFVSLRSLAGHAPAVLCVLLLALLSASLASQTRSLRRELAAVAERIRGIAAEAGKRAFPGKAASGGPESE